MLFSERVPPVARKAYKKDAASGMLAAVMIGLTGPFIAVIARDKLGATDLEMGLISVSAVAGNFFSLFVARMLEGRRKMPFTVISVGLARALFLLFLFVTTHWAFVALVVAINIIATLCGPAYSSLMKEIYPDGDRARIMGFTRVCMWSVSIIITAVGAWLLDIFSYRYIFPIAGVFGVASIIVFGKISAHEASGDPSIGHLQFFKDSFKILHEDRGYAWFCAGIFCWGFANFMATPIYAIFQVDELGVKTTWAGIYSIVCQIAVMISFMHWGGYIDRLKPERVVAMQTLAYSTIPLIYVFAVSPWMLLPAMIIMGVLNAGAELSYFSGVLHFAPEDKITQYQAIFAVLMGIRGVIAPIIGTKLLENHILSAREIFLLTSAMILVGFLVQLAGERKYGSVVKTAGLRDAASEISTR